VWTEYDDDKYKIGERTMLSMQERREKDYNDTREERDRQ